jgi:DNA-binding NarL/FixJ family response regulator
MKKIRIAITDDDALIVALLSEFLSADPRFEVLFAVTGGEQLFGNLKDPALVPDVLLLDLKMKDTDGITVTRELKGLFPDVHVIVISSHYQPSYTGFMVKTGVSAFLPKGIMPRELASVIEIVMERGVYFLPGQIDVLRGQISSRVAQPVIEAENSLTDREIEILRLLCQQKTAKEIGEQLFIAQRTVEGHKNNLFLKTGVKNITGLVIYAIQRGIIKLEELPVI